jgi:uncharacterized protein (TIGR00290 family)
MHRKKVNRLAQPVALSFSGGKDSSYALYALKQDPAWRVERLLATATREYGRNSMHGIRMELVQQQAESIGIPLDVVWLNANGSGDDYERAMERMLQRYKEQGIEHVAFGDLYLEDVRQYREQLNAAAGIHSIFPVWGRPTRQFAEQFIAAGFKAVVVCVDTTQLDASFCGREFDASFLADLPEGIDWCAENGEFHTFCYDGPIFREPIAFRRGDYVLRDGRFYYLDLVPLD